MKKLYFLSSTLLALLVQQSCKGPDVTPPASNNPSATSAGRLAQTGNTQSFNFAMSLSDPKGLDILTNVNSGTPGAAIIAVADGNSIKIARANGSSSVDQSYSVTTTNPMAVAFGPGNAGGGTGQNAVTARAKLFVVDQANQIRAITSSDSWLDLSVTTLSVSAPLFQLPANFTVADITIDKTAAVIYVGGSSWNGSTGKNYIFKMNIPSTSIPTTPTLITQPYWQDNIAVPSPVGPPHGFKITGLWFDNLSVLANPTSPRVLFVAATNLEADPWKNQGGFMGVKMGASDIIQFFGGTDVLVDWMTPNTYAANDIITKERPYVYVTKGNQIVEYSQPTGTQVFQATGVTANSQPGQTLTYQAPFRRTNTSKVMVVSRGSTNQLEKTKEDVIQ